MSASPHFSSIVLPVGALTAALLLTQAKIDNHVTLGTMRAGAWFVQARSGYFQGYHPHRTDVFEGSFGIGHHLRDWLAVGMDFHATRLRDDRLGTGAVGGRPFVRWRLFTVRKFTLFFEQGLGMIFSVDDFPPGGTKANFTPTYGPGMNLKLLEQVYLTVSATHYHISNGGLIAGTDRNPGFDSNGARIGFHFQF